MKTVLTISFCLCYSSLAYAEYLQLDIDSFVLKNGNNKNSKDICYIPNLTLQQLFIYDEIRRLHLKDTKQVRARLEKQKKAYEKILKDKKILTSGFADEMADKLFRTNYNLTKEKTAFFHAVYYKILVKQQRESLVQCLQKP